MKNDWGKTPRINFFRVMSISLLFLTTVHAQIVPAVPPAKPSIPLDIDSQKGLKNDSNSPKISQDLMNIYKSYQARKREGWKDLGGEGDLGQPRIPISDGFVTIDAIASNNAATLKKDMETLGLKNSAMFGRVVSGLFPIAEIPKLSALKSLKFVRASSVATHK